MNPLPRFNGLRFGKRAFSSILTKSCLYSGGKIIYGAFVLPFNIGDPIYRFLWPAGTDSLPLPKVIEFSPFNGDGTIGTYFRYRLFLALLNESLNPVFIFNSSSPTYSPVILRFLSNLYLYSWSSSVECRFDSSASWKSGVIGYFDIDISSDYSSFSISAAASCLLFLIFDYNCLGI